MTNRLLSPPRAMLFDWDNTLIDSWTTIHDVQNIVLEAFGLDAWSLDEIRARVRKSMRDSYPAIFGERWEEAGRMFYREYEARHLDSLQPLPGVVDMLPTLVARGFYLGVVSNKRGNILRREAQHLGWDAHFSAVVGAGDAEQDKPAVAPVAMALAPGQLMPGADTWFVGDTDIDLACAHRAGCVAVLVRPETPGPDEFADVPADLYFSDCLALSNYVLTL
jgi:phosphoglycolate phosphatase